MASYEVANSKTATLAANVEDRVTVTGADAFVTVINHDGAAWLSARIYAGSPATVDGDDTIPVPPLTAVELDVRSRPDNPVVSLISSGTPKYTVVGD